MVARCVMGRTVFFVFGTCSGVSVTLGRGAWCRMSFCAGKVRVITLGGRTGCRFSIYVGTG